MIPENSPLSLKKKLAILICSIFVLALSLSYAAWFLIFSVPDFKNMQIDEPRFGDKGAAVVKISAGDTASELAIELERKGVIHSSKTLLMILENFRLGGMIKQGTYVFEKPQSALGAVRKITSGQYGYEQVRITIPEGFTVKAIAEALPAKLIDIKEEDFLSAAKDLEGYLFPDTYFLYPYATSSTVISMMKNNFDKKISALEKEMGIKLTDDELRSKIILASILEKEVQTPEDMGLVAGLFLKRMEVGMPLQADSTLTYVTGRSSKELRVSDLTGSSPYNSYKQLGLPPTPISNPGLNAIKASFNPTQTDFLFFLSDNTGKTHFSKTYAEHLRLKEKYLP